MSRFRTDRTPARRTVQSTACSPSALNEKKAGSVSDGGIGCVMRVCSQGCSPY